MSAFGPISISSADGSDVIMDFEAGGASAGSAADIIDLRSIDANARRSPALFRCLRSGQPVDRIRHAASSAPR